MLTDGTGVNGFAGGFVVNPTAEVSLTVDYNDWARGFNNVPPPATATITPDRLNQFLNAGEDRLVAASGGTPSALDFDDIHDDSDTDNGVAWFSVEANSKRYHYAGIFETTDLGVPVTGKTDATVMWNGQFESSIGDLKTSTAFELEITFGTVAGFPNSVGKLEAFVERNNQTSPATIFFHLNGTYDAKGVITGKVYYGEFSDTTARTQTTAGAANGVLSGLIGSNGAVGVFTSGTAIDADGVITGGTNENTGYVGGFVASPFAGAVSYRTWVRDTSPNNSPIITGDRPLNQFLTATGNVLDKGESYTRAEFNLNMSSLNGDPNDGFSVYQTVQNNYFAGISSTTSLGAALPYRQMFNEQTEAEWDGMFLLYRIDGSTTTEFKLMVDFANSDISATDVAGYSFTDVTFDASGVVSQGTITHTATGSTGLLQGLIGSNGTVGVFHSDGSNLFTYGGGFVAAPTVMEDMPDMPNMPDMPDPDAPNYATFEKHYGAKTDNTQLHPNLTTGGTAAFVEIPSAGLDTNGLTFTNSGNFMPVTIRLDEASSGDNGFVIMGARISNTPVSSTPVYRAGLLSTTDLGAALGPALDNPISTSWTGTAYTSAHVDSANNNVPISIPLTLTVDFDLGTIKTDGEIRHGVNRNLYMQINGEFKGGTKDNGLPVGILGGTVNYFYNSGQQNELPLIGLIGEEGAIGVFINGTGVGGDLVGGFQATPD